MIKNLLFAALLATVGLGAAMAGPAAVDLGAVAARRSPSSLPTGWQQGAFIEIFVRAYQDSDGDGIGDLRGLTSRLDYLKELGIRGIWLMPIQASADHDHGYATVDYRAIEPAYGTLADFDELIRQAHARGIGVITDYVINHSAAEHPLFVDSALGPRSPYRSWYVWRDRAPTGWSIWDADPWTATANGAYFGTFGPDMPDFNFRNPAVIEYHRDSMRFWLNRGIDGFRLDAVPHLVERNAKDWNDQPESRRITRELRRLVQSYPGRHVVCEATANPVVYGAASLCGSAFAFTLETNIVKSVRSAGGDAKALRAVADYFKTAPLTMATMISNHDIFAGRRLWDQVQGDETQYRLAAATYLLLPGTPFVYYGEEIGLAGVGELAGDGPLRAPMSWSAGPGAGFTTSATPFRPISPNAATHNVQAAQADPGSLLHFYKALIGLRNELPSIARGSYERATVSGQALSFQRRLGREHSVVLVNYGTAPAEIRVRGLGAGRTLATAYPAEGASLEADAGGAATLTLPPQSVRVFVRRR
jgi:alpha-amylase